MRNGTPLALVFIYIDHFKQINDRHGHLAGDQVLRCAARRLVTTLRASDSLLRWGGEEFLILMPECTAQMAQTVMGRLGASIAALGVRVNEDLLGVTASMGIAELRPEETYSNTINRADLALLRAKRSGRNRCELAD